MNKSQLSSKPRLGFISTTMGSFDAVLDVPEVRDMNQYENLIIKIIDRLKTFADVINFGMAGNEEDATLLHERIIQSDADLFVIFPVNYTLDVVILKLILGLRVPVILLNSAPLSTIPEDMDANVTMENTTIACIPTITNVLIKNNIPYDLVNGTVNDDSVYDEIRKCSFSAMIVRKLRNTRIGVIGQSYPGISAVSVAESLVTGKFGVTLVRLDTNEIAKECSAVPDSEVKRLSEEIQTKWSVTDITSGEITASIRLLPALEKIIEKYKINAIAELCSLLVANNSIGIVPCYAATILTGRGIPFTCECDIATTIAMLILQGFSKDALFLEFYVQDFKQGLSLLSHCGIGNLNLARQDSPVCIKQHPYFPGAKGRGISFEYLTRKGLVTYASLTVVGGRWRMIAGLGESVEMQKRPMSAVQLYFKFKGNDFNRSLKKYCELGGIHHMAVAFGNYLDELRLTCRYLDIDFFTPED